ncbi:MAG: TRAP transporter small permease subunit [Thermoanaerobaculia bacterium]
MRRFREYLALLGRAVEVTLIAILGGLVVLVTADTALWSLFEYSSPIVAEVQAILQIWFGFLAAAIGVRYGSHLSLNLLVSRLSQRARHSVGVFVHLVEAMFGLFFVIYGAQLVRTVSNTLPGLGIGASSQYVPACSAGVLIIIFSLEKTFSSAHQDSTDQEMGTGDD